MGTLKYKSVLFHYLISVQWHLCYHNLLHTHSSEDFYSLFFSVCECPPHILPMFYLPTGCHRNKNVCGHLPKDITRRNLGTSLEIEINLVTGDDCVWACAWMRTRVRMFKIQYARGYMRVCVCVSRTPPVTGECHVWWSLLPYTCSAPAINFADANEPYCITEA